MVLQQIVQDDKAILAPISMAARLAQGNNDRILNHKSISCSNIHGNDFLFIFLVLVFFIILVPNSVAISTQHTTMRLFETSNSSWMPVSKLYWNIIPNPWISSGYFWSIVNIICWRFHSVWIALLLLRKLYCVWFDDCCCILYMDKPLIQTIARI